MGVIIDPEHEHTRLSCKWRHRALAQAAAQYGSAASSVFRRPIPLCVFFGVFPLVWFGSFLVLDDALCVVGECEFCQCCAEKHSAVSHDASDVPS